MSTRKLDEAPLRSTVLNEYGKFGKVWLQFMGDMADSLFGTWGRTEDAVDLTGVTYETLDNTTQFMGTKLRVYLKMVDPVFSGATITIDYAVKDDVIRFWDGTDVNYIPVVDSTFTIPDQSITGTVYISGEFLRDLGE